MTMVWVTMFQIDSLTATIKQLELERGQLYDSLKEQRHLSDNLSVKVADLQEDVIRKCKLLSQFCWEPGMLGICHCGENGNGMGWAVLLSSPTRIPPTATFWWLLSPTSNLKKMGSAMGCWMGSCKCKWLDWTIW